jgi:predicted nucleic acid-binding protein
MKHVFVETNFLVSLLRPFPAQDALALFARNDGVDLRLYIPWCSQAEARRTLTGIIKADLGFTDTMMDFVLRRWLPDRTLFDKREIDKVKTLADADRREALSTLDQRIRDAVGHMTRIDPSPAVVARTLQVFAVKALKPFDEMVLGAVLATATELYGAGEREILFCELDGDLATEHPPLVREYEACGLALLHDFNVPA